MKTNEVNSGCENPRERESAFTFVDLMAVFATLAILALLVLPALARSYDDSSRAVCMNNLRQLGMASNMYAGDNRDYLPFCNWDAGNVYGPGWLYGLGMTLPDPTVQPYVNNPDSAWNQGLWYQYVRNPKAYLCPIDIKSSTYVAPAAAGGRLNKLSSYVMDGAVSGFPQPPAWQSCKITDVWSPLCYLLWNPDENLAGPGNPGAYAYNDGANYPNFSEGLAALHVASAGEVLCVGGNVQSLTRAQFRADSTTPAGSGPGPGGKTYAWWSPFSSNGH